MKVSEILKTKGSRVATVPPNAAVKTALKQMQAENIGALVVSRDGEAILGIVSERDVVRCLVTDGASVIDKMVADIMGDLGKRQPDVVPAQALPVDETTPHLVERARAERLPQRSRDRRDWPERLAVRSLWRAGDHDFRLLCGGERGQRVDPRH